MKYAFILGREWKLSLAELVHRFGYGNLLDYNQEIAIFELAETLSSSAIFSLGGTTRIIEILTEISPETFPTDVISEIEKLPKNSKVHFALASFGLKFPLSDAGMRMKKTLSKNFSVRFLNAKNENIHSAVFKKEKLAKTGLEFSILTINSLKKKEENNETDNSSQKFFLGKTLACQDIDAYARRDLAKNRDMIVGMMPPKLVQMMLNLAENFDENFQKFSVYDPFCGLGTTLIEAINMGAKSVFGSDISAEMVSNSSESFKNFVREERIWQERIKTAGGVPAKDFSNISSRFFVLDATKVKRAFTEEKIPKDVTIISEGYLGKIMKKHEMTQDVVLSEKRSISRLYEAFFKELNEANFHGKIVMSFPFWKVQNVYIFVENLAEILDANGFKMESLLPREMDLNTKNGSLLYRRESQNVGREIVKIVRK